MTLSFFKFIFLERRLWNNNFIFTFCVGIGDTLSSAKDRRSQDC